MERSLMTIRQMCTEYEVTPRTLRFYESKELLSPVRQGQKRLFTNRDRARLKLILRGKHFGFSLEEIRQLLDLYDLGDNQQAQLRRSYEIGTKRLGELIRERDRLSRSIEDLGTHLDWAQNQIGSSQTLKAAE